MFSKIINHLEEAFIGLLLSAMTLIYFSNVIARYVFNTGWVWVVELTTYLFAWMVLFGISYGVRVGSHIGVDILIRHMSHRWQQIFAGITAIIGIVYAVLVFVGGWDYVSLIYELELEAEDLPVQQWVPYSILLVGSALLALRFAEVIYKLMTGQEVHMLLDEAHDALDEHHHEHFEYHPPEEKASSKQDNAT